MTQPDRVFLTAEQLAERWDVPKSQVYALSRDGKIPYLRLGKHYRYKLSAIEAWEDHAATTKEAA